MATIDWKAINTKLGKRCETYALKVRSIMEQRIGEVVSMCEGLELQDGKPFVFADYPEVSRKVQATFRLMYTEIYQQVRGNITQEWYYSNADMDGLLAGLFGKQAMQDKHFARYFARNKEAMNQFFARKEAGMNLSQRVWSIAGNAKQELEVALDLGLGQGLDAGDLSRKVRQYLQEPDMLFRRFRYREQEPVLDDKGKAVLDENGKPVMQPKVDAEGKPVYGRKWKRRHYDKATDSFYWVDDAPTNYRTGRGVYRSSYKNAMRLTRTETNMAYRAADCERWKEMEFVRGFKVVRSKNHPVEDICDLLSAADENDNSGKGVYPKGFVFKGWHPHCFCYCVPLLCSEDELMQLTDQILRGEDTSGFAPAGMVEQPNAHFLNWVDDNKDRISDTINDPQRGWANLPYFLQDNYQRTGKGNWVQVVKNEAGLDTWGKVLQKGEIDIDKYSKVQSVLADEFTEASNFVTADNMPLLAGNAKLGNEPLTQFAQLEDSTMLQTVMQQGNFGVNGLLNYTSEAELAELERIATQAKFASKADGTFVTALNNTDLHYILKGDTAVFNGGRYVGTNYSETLASALKNGVVAESDGAVAVLKLPKGSRYAQMLVEEQPAALLLPNSKFKVVSTEVKTIMQAGKATKVTHYTLELVEDGSEQVKQVVQAMQQTKADVRAYDAARKRCGNVYNIFHKGKYDLLGLDTVTLEQAIANGDTAMLQAEAKKLMAEMKAAKKAALAKAVDEPVEWVLVQQYGEADTKAFFTNWNKHMGKAGSLTEQEFLKDVIDKELYWAKKNPNKYPTTGEFIKYFEKQKQFYENRIALAALQPDIDLAVQFAKTTKSAKVKNIVAELQTLAAGGNANLSDVQAKLAQAQAEIQRIEKARLAALQKKSGGLYDIEQFYSPADKAEINRLRAELDKAIADANGDLRDWNVVNAQAKLAKFTVDLGENYVNIQPKLATIGGLSDAQVAQAMQDYLGKKPNNPVIWIAEDLTKLTQFQLSQLDTLQLAVQDAWDDLQACKTAQAIRAAQLDLKIAQDALNSYCGSLPYGALKHDYAFGKDVGGAYAIKKQKMLDYSLKLASMGIDIPWEELSLIMRYTHGSNFINHYCFGFGSVRRAIDPVITQQLTKILEDYKTAVNHVMERMPRYNGITYRGVDIEPAAIKHPTEDGFWNSIIEAWKRPDKIWVSESPTSSTYNLSIADGFADGGIMGKVKGQRVIMKIHGKTGVDVTPTGYYDHEAEIMFRAGSKFRMLKAPYKCTNPRIGKIGDWVVEVEEIL